MSDGRDGRPRETNPELLKTRVSAQGIGPQDELPAGGAERVPVLLVLQGHDIGRRYLLNEPSLTIGRHPQAADLVVPGDLEISSIHVRVERAAGALLVTDHNSTNGTRLNERKLTPHQPVTLTDGDKLFVGRTVLKFTYQDELEEHFHVAVERMMNIDELTGLVVKRSFDRNLEWALSAARAARSPVTVLMMDMDGLKGINDRHGHHVGAGTIAQVGHILDRIVNPHGGVTRFGGDEFTAYLEGCPRADGLKVAEQIRATVESHEFVVADVRVQPTISIGLSSMPQDGSQPAELVRAADAALYRAKAAGRNCVSE